MSPLHRRVLRLEAVSGRRVFTHLSDAELDDRLRAELCVWLRDDPGACPADVREDVDAFLAAAASTDARP